MPRAKRSYHERVFLCWCLFTSCVLTKPCSRRRSRHLLQLWAHQPSVCGWVSVTSLWHMLLLLRVTVFLSSLGYFDTRSNRESIWWTGDGEYLRNVGEHLGVLIHGEKYRHTLYKCFHMHKHLSDTTTYCLSQSFGDTHTKRTHTSAVIAAADRGCCRTVEVIRPIRW